MISIVLSTAMIAHFGLSRATDTFQSPLLYAIRHWAREHLLRASSPGRTALEFDHNVPSSW